MSIALSYDLLSSVRFGSGMLAFAIIMITGRDPESARGYTFHRTIAGKIRTFGGRIQTSCGGEGPGIPGKALDMGEGSTPFCAL